jgi:hypothetical protein
MDLNCQELWNACATSCELPLDPDAKILTIEVLQQISNLNQEKRIYYYELLKARKTAQGRRNSGMKIAANLELVAELTKAIVEEYQCEVHSASRRFNDKK